MLLRHWFPIALSILLLLALPGFVLFALDLAGESAAADAWLEDHLGLSHHLAIGNAAGLVLFLVPLLLLLLYFLKLKRKPLPVSSTFLWKKSIEDLHVNRLMQWLRRNVLLLLQLLIIFVLLYAILGPRLNGSPARGKHYILLVDNSASMSATDMSPTSSKSPSRLEWAKREALKEIDAATDEDAGMVIVFNTTAEIRQSYTSNRGLLRQAIAEIQPTHFSTRIEEALNLAASLANQDVSTENEAVRPANAEPGKERTYAAPEGMSVEAHLYSDGRFGDAPTFALSNLNLNYHRAGLTGPDGSNNLAVTGFRAVRDPDQPTNVRTSVDLANYRMKDAPIGLDLDVQVEGQPFDVRQRKLTLPARTLNVDETGNVHDLPGKRTLTFDLTGIPENADAVVHVKIDNAADALALDDEAWLVLGIVRKARVLIIGPGNPVLNYFFDSRSVRRVADVAYLKPEQLKERDAYLNPAREGDFDLVIFDRCGPTTEEEMPRANTMFVGWPPPPWHFDGADDPYRVETIRFPPVRGWSDRHPVMQGLRGWHELEIAEAFRMRNLPEKTPRLLESDGNLLLMLSLSRQSYSDLVLTFPLQTADVKWNTRWFLRPLFPHFLRNLLYSMGRIRDAAAEESLRPGQVKLFEAGHTAEEWRVRLPSGAWKTLERGGRPDLLFGETGELGVYEARWDDQRRRFAVNLFDPLESNIEPRDSIQIGAEKIETGQVRKEPRELWRWFVALGLLVVLVEWWIYNRRVQV